MLDLSCKSKHADLKARQLAHDKERYENWFLNLNGQKDLLVTRNFDDFINYFGSDPIGTTTPQPPPIMPEDTCSWTMSSQDDQDIIAYHLDYFTDKEEVPFRADPELCISPKRKKARLSIATPSNQPIPLFVPVYKKTI